jgi:hypothetical protein
MRYLSLLFFVALMGLTWSYIESTAAVPESTHIDIQDDIKLMISDTLVKSLPQVRDVRFDRFWTQNLGPNKVKATFLFSFENGAETEDPARYGIEGHAVLNFDAQNGVWNVEGPHFVNNAITFKDGIIIRPGADDGE